MGVGLYISGTVGAATDDLLAVVERFVRHYQGEDLLGTGLGQRHDGQTALYVRTHPAAEAIELWSSSAGGAQRLTVSAKTSTVGPGYHADICEMLHALGEQLSISWDSPEDEEGTGDETGYFLTRDREALEQQMLQWLSSVVAILFERADEYTGLQLSMPMAPRYLGPPDAWLLTPTGPRSRAWAEAVRADPRAGIDVFPWWEPGRGARTELGRVAVHLWMDVRWRPAVTDEEEELAVELLRRLERAFQLDPSLDYPWAAWEALHDEVLDVQDTELTALVRARTSQGARGPLGYREFLVEESLAGGWKLTLPGSFSVEIDDEGTWVAHEGGAALWATAFSRPEPERPEDRPSEPELPQSSREGIPVPITLDPSLRGRAFQRSFDEEGERYWQLLAEIATVDRLLLLTMVAPEGSPLDWAQQVIASVRA